MATSRRETYTFCASMVTRGYSCGRRDPTVRDRSLRGDGMCVAEVAYCRTSIPIHWYIDTGIPIKKYTSVLGSCQRLIVGCSTMGRDKQKETWLVSFCIPIPEMCRVHYNTRQVERVERDRERVRSIWMSKYVAVQSCMQKRQPINSQNG